MDGHVLVRRHAMYFHVQHVVLPCILHCALFLLVISSENTERIIVRVGGADVYDHCENGPPAG